MAETGKKNMRIPDPIWDPAEARAEEIAALGYRGEHRKFSTTDLVRVSMQLVQDKTAQQTIDRLGLQLPAAD